MNRIRGSYYDAMKLEEHLRKIKRTCELTAGLEKLMDSIADT